MFTVVWGLTCLLWRGVSHVYCSVGSHMSSVYKQSGGVGEWKREEQRKRTYADRERGGREREIERRRVESDRGGEREKERGGGER